MNAAQAFVRTLRRCGGDTFFGLPGSTEAPLLEALREDGGVRYVLALHEGAAVAMADGYARATGKVGVVGVHTTVGTMNALSQAFNSTRDGVPVVLTAGHKERAVLADEGFCALPDLAALPRSFMKSSWQSLSAESVAGDLARAMSLAAAPPRGPAYLVVPEDLMRAELAPGAGEGPEASGPRGWAELPPEAEVLAAARLLAGAQNPALVLGTHAAGATAEARALAEALALPVLAADLTDLGALSFPTSDIRYLGVWGEEPRVLEGCDLVLAAGCRLFYPFSDRLRPRLPAGASVIHVHPDPRELGKSVPAARGLCGAPGPIMAALAEAAAGAVPEATLERRRGRLAELAEARHAALERERETAWEASPASVTRVATELGRALPPGAIVVEEGVRASRLIFRHLGLPAGGEIWRSSGGSLGWGLPAAVGAKLGRPDRPVVLLTGDGSFHFSVQALWTAVSQQAPLVAVILDNQGYLAVKRAVEGHLGVPMDPRTHPGTEIRGIDHVAVARGYGAAGVSIEDPADLAPAFREALSSGGVRVIAVRVGEVRP